MLESLPRTPIPEITIYNRPLRVENDFLLVNEEASGGLDTNRLSSLLTASLLDPILTEIFARPLDYVDKPSENKQPAELALLEKPRAYMEKLTGNRDFIKLVENINKFNPDIMTLVALKKRSIIKNKQDYQTEREKQMVYGIFLENVMNTFINKNPELLPPIPEYNLDLEVLAARYQIDLQLYRVIESEKRRQREMKIPKKPKSNTLSDNDNEINETEKEERDFERNQRECEAKAQSMMREWIIFMLRQSNQTPLRWNL
jgi:hypothetical protein